MQDLATLVQAHEDIYRSFSGLVRELDAEDWDRPTGCPGWTVRDQVAHVASLEGLLAGDAYPSDHELPDDLAHVRDDIGRFMEALVDVRRSRSADELVTELDDVFDRRRAQLAEHTDIAEEAPSLLGAEQPLYRTLPIRVVDLYSHEQDVRRAVGRPGHLTGAAPELIVDRFAKGLTATLPQRLDDDATVVFALAGDPPREVTVEFGPADGAVLRLPVTVEQFVALGGGRSDAPGVDDLDVEGDRELARRILAACGLTP